MTKFRSFHVAILGALCLTAHPARADFSGSIELDAPPDSVAGRPIPIAVRVKGLETGVPVVVHYRTASSTTYQAMALEARGDDFWSGTMPETNDLGVRYYIAVGAEEGPSIRLGSARAPFRLDLAPATAEVAGSTSLPVIVIGGALSLLALTFGFQLLDKRRRLAIAEQSFWATTLESFIGMPRHVVSTRLQKLALTPLDHPTSGPTTFPYPVLIQKLGELVSRAEQRSQPLPR